MKAVNAIKYLVFRGLFLKFAVTLQASKAVLFSFKIGVSKIFKIIIQ